MKKENFNTPIVKIDTIDEAEVPEAVSASQANRSFVRKFVHFDEDGHVKGYVDEPSEGTSEAFVAAVREDRNALMRILDADSSQITATGGVIFDCRGFGEPCEDLPLIQVVASWPKNLKPLQDLVARGADVNTYHESGSPLQYVLYWSCNLDALEFLISAGADINVDAKCGGKTPLFHALESGDMELVKFFISKGADVLAKLWDGATMLHAATNPVTPSSTSESCLYFVKHFVDCGCDLHAKNYFGTTALHNAASTPNPAVLQFLLDRKADVHAQDNFGLTPLDYACTEEARQLLRERE